MTPMGPQNIYGTIVNGKIVEQPTQGSGGFGEVTPPPSGYDPKVIPPGVDPKTGIDPKTGYNEGYLSTIDPQFRQQVKDLADYKTDPNAVGYKQKGGLQMMVSNYTNGQYRSDVYPNIKAAETEMARSTRADSHIV